MTALAPAHKLHATLLALACAACAAATRAQQRPPSTPTQKPTVREETKPAEQDEVLRIETELVQSAVVVVDKGGKFVEGLRREQFEMRIDGRPQPISFFEQVEAGTPRERQQLADARGEAKAAVESASSERGQTVFLFVDDMRLDAAAYVCVRRSLLHYIDKVMGDNDRAAIASTSGQIGFLQQLTDDKAVLREAVARLNFRPAGADTGRPPISVYQAFAVQEYGDPDVTRRLVEETMREHHTDDDPLLRIVGAREAESDVNARTRAIVEREGSINRATFSTLESLLRGAAQLHGRKLVFFFTGGLMLRTKDPDDTERLSRVVDAAARSDAVVYTVDARGLATDPQLSASRSGSFDLYGQGTRSSMSMGEIPASQQALLALAGDTGGRAVLNTNALDAGIARALEDESRYYLLAWRPEVDANRGGKFRRIEVSVAGRPDLTVRLHRGYYSPPTQRAAKADKTHAAATPQAELGAAVAAAYPRTELPALLTAHYVASADAGATLTASVGVSSESLTFRAGDGGRAAAAELACFLIDDRGKQLQSYFARLDLSARAGEGAVPRRDVTQDFQFKDLRPGLYQLRAAARDAESGRIGGASRWIEIPDLSKGQLVLGSIVVAESAGDDPLASALAPIKLSAGGPLARGSRLHFSTHVYNAARAGGGGLPPSVTMRAIVMSGGRELIDAGEREVQTDGLEDFARLPYAGEISLAELPPGHYLLLITATDRVAGKSATQLTKFSIR